MFKNILDIVNTIYFGNKIMLSTSKFLCDKIISCILDNINIL